MYASLVLYACETGSPASFEHEKTKAPEKIAAHLLLEKALLAEFGIERHEIVYPPVGRPFLKGLPVPHFSLSHTRGLAVCALSNFAVGVDAEPLDRTAEKVAGKYFSAAEREFIARVDSGFARLWTLKEAYGKFTGEGIIPMLRVPFVDSGRVIAFIGECRLAELGCFKEHAVSLAVHSGLNAQEAVVKKLAPDALGL